MTYLIQRRSLIAAQPGTIADMRKLLDEFQAEGAPDVASLEIENGQVYCGWEESEHGDHDRASSPAPVGQGPAPEAG